MKRIRFIASSAALVALGYFFRDAASFVNHLMDGKVKLCTLPTPVHDTEIAIFTDTFQEASQALYYEVRTGGEIRVPMSAFEYTAVGAPITRASFLLMRADDLVGVAFASNPKTIVIMHDFATDETWPKPDHTEHIISTGKHGHQLLRRLKEKSAVTYLKLSSDA